MSKIDLKKTFKTLYQPPKDPLIVEVPAFNFILLDGRGNPNHNPIYQQTVSALFQLSYAIKFSVKKSQGVDYGVAPLEGLWWVEDMAQFSIDHKEDWLWTMMIMQPEYVSADLFAELRDKVMKEKSQPVLAQARFAPYAEGTVVQLMHSGPYATEGPNIARMHAYAAAQGYHNHGKHHEIYLSDVNKTAPEKLKTILRQPVTQSV